MNMLTIEQKLYVVVPVTPSIAQEEQAQSQIDEAAEQNLRSIIGEKGELISFRTLEARVPCLKTEMGYIRKDAPEAAAYHPQETRAFYYLYLCQMNVSESEANLTPIGDTVME